MTGSVPAKTVREALKRKPPWLVLCLGFGGLLFFILAACIGSLLMLGHVRQQETAMRQAFLSRLGALDQLRAGIYLSGTYVRDFLLSPDADGAQAQAVRLVSLEKETRAALDGYARTAAPDERSAVSGPARGDRCLLAGARQHSGLDAGRARPHALFLLL